MNRKEINPMLTGEDRNPEGKRGLFPTLNPWDLDAATQIARPGSENEVPVELLDTEVWASGGKKHKGGAPAGKGTPRRPKQKPSKGKGRQKEKSKKW